MKRGRVVLGLLGLVVLGSCQRGEPSRSATSAGSIRAAGGVERTERLASDRAAIEQTIYVPIYSSIATADNARPINLAVTLTVRNLDRAQPLVVQAISYHDSGGKLVRKALDSPMRVGPLAALNLFLGESDNSGGPSPSFLVDWAAESSITPPLVEAVMISTAGSLGLTFNTVGRVIASRP